MASVSPPEGPYDPVRSGDELESLLQTGSADPLYLQLQDRSVFRIFSGLMPSENTVAHIRCGDSTIDMTDSEEYTAAPGTELTFWGCNIHRAHSNPLAEQTTYHRCNVYGTCEGPTEEQSPFVFLSAQSFQQQYTQQEGRMVVKWNNSNFTCSPEDVKSLGDLESETLTEVVKAEWPYIALAGGLMLLAIVTCIALVVRRSRLRSKRVLAQHGSGHRSGPSAGPKTPPDASVPMPRHRWSGTQSQGTTPVSQRGPMPRASASQMLFVEESGTRFMPSGSANPMSPATLSEGPPGTPGTPQGTSVSSFNSDLPAAIQQTMAQFKRELPDVPLDILQHIGSGGYGNVYRGSWKGLEVAIKTIVFQDRLQDGTAERVIKEAAIACNMSNDHVVNTFAHELKRMPVQVPGELVDYKLYIIQEFCVGGSLAKLLTGEHLMTSVGGVQINRVLTVLRHVASGMAYMHKLRMVHGDLNPSNVFLQLSDNKYVQTPRRRKKAWKPLTKEAARGLDDGNCTVKLGDFGLTVQLQHGCTHVSNITHGTPFYSAPELATKGRLQCESDVYSFGVLMWEMYHNDTPYDMQDDNYIPNPQFGRFSPTVPLNYALLAISCLSAQPEDRPSFGQVIEFLAAIGLELASGYYTNIDGVTEPTSVICQTPISEMVDYAPETLLQIHSKIHGSSMQTSSMQPASLFAGASSQKPGRSPKHERRHSRGPSPRGQGQSASVRSSARSQSWHASSLSRSSGKRSSRSTRGSPRPVGEHAVAFNAGVGLATDRMSAIESLNETKGSGVHSSSDA